MNPKIIIILILDTGIGGNVAACQLRKTRY